MLVHVAVLLCKENSVNICSKSCFACTIVLCINFHEIPLQRFRKCFRCCRVFGCCKIFRVIARLCKFMHFRKVCFVDWCFHLSKCIAFLMQLEHFLFSMRHQNVIKAKSKTLNYCTAMLITMFVIKAAYS